MSPSFSFLVYKIWRVTVLTIEIGNNIYLLNSKQGECSTNGSHYYYCPMSRIIWDQAWMPDSELGLSWERPGIAQVRGGPSVSSSEYLNPSWSGKVETEKRTLHRARPRDVASV